MTQYSGVFVAFEQAQTITTADVLIELQCAAGTQIEIIRAWCSMEGAVADAMQEIEIYINNDAATAGTGLTEQSLRGASPTSGVTALGGPTQGATPIVVYPDSFHVQNGWLYLPVPEERIKTDNTNDNVGVKFPAAPDASTVFTYGMVWGEIA